MEFNSTTHGEYSAPNSTELGKCDLSNGVAAGTTVVDDFSPVLLTAAGRPFSYNKSHCWQFDIRLRNRQQDLIDAALSPEEAAAITVRDLTFRFVDKSEVAMCSRIVQFVKRHEWLGEVCLFPSHRFVAEYKGQVAGVVILSMPTAFCKLLGGETKDLERLISRGACISWTPKNTASKLLMYAINWMVGNTPYRLFSAYADPEAREIGQIYSACNFIYLGQRYGGGRMYFDPANPERGYFGDRSFRSRSAYKRYAKTLGIDWKPEWQQGEKIYWDRIPEDIASQLRAHSKAEQARCEYRILPRKHKYVLVRGTDRQETKQLMQKFTELNPKLVGLAYPKRQVDSIQEETEAVTSPACRN
jgi:hypothetical protein